MPLTKVKIGNLIRLNNQTNADGRDLPFYGLNKDKEFMPTVASITKVDKCKYKVATKGRFVFSGMQTGVESWRMCVELPDFVFPSMHHPYPSWQTISLLFPDTAFPC